MTQAQRVQSVFALGQLTQVGPTQVLHVLHEFEQPDIWEGGVPPTTSRSAAGPSGRIVNELRLSFLLSACRFITLFSASNLSDRAFDYQHTSCRLGAARFR